MVWGVVIFRSFVYVFVLFLFFWFVSFIRLFWERFVNEDVCNVNILRLLDVLVISLVFIYVFCCW